MRARTARVSERQAPRHVPGLTPALRARLQRFFAVATRVSPSLAARLAFELFMTPPRRRIEPQDVPVLARAERHPLPLDRGSVRAFEWRGASTPADAPGVLLLHGWGSHAARFGSFIAPLEAAGLRAVGLDAPAHGESPGRVADLSRFRAAMEAAVARFAPIRGIVGHSMGASATVMSLAERHPPQLQAIVLVGMPSDMGYIMDSFELLLGLRADVRARLRRHFTQRFGAPPETWSNHAVADRLHVRTLLVHDEDDDVAPIEHAQRLAELLTGGQLHATRGLAHSGALRDAATIARIVAFIRDGDSARA
jgi:pimeloyl-ACP methyl ester carboxylesterase